MFQERSREKSHNIIMKNKERADGQLHTATEDKDF